jgi:acyl-coenzyme A thioesterase PaaI-like protein
MTRKKGSMMLVPYARHSGVEKLTEDTLVIHSREDILNHIGTIHAGALYTLAESQSGLFLQRMFPALEGRVVPLLREGSMKYRKPVQDTVHAEADVREDVLEKFEMMFAKKGRGSITVTVVLKDKEGSVCAAGEFVWFVQKRDEA